MVENARLRIREIDQASLTCEGENIQRESVTGRRQGSYQDEVLLLVKVVAGPQVTVDIGSEEFVIC